MGTKLVQARLDEEDVAWLDTEAEKLQTTRSHVVKLAVRSMRRNTVPDLILETSAVLGPTTSKPAAPIPLTSVRDGGSKGSIRSTAKSPEREYHMDPETCTHKLRDRNGHCPACGDRK